MSGRTSPAPILSIAETIKANTRLPPAKRTKKQIAELLDAVRGIKYFSKIAEVSGSKVLFEYAKYIGIMRVTINSVLKDMDNFYILLTGKVLCHSKQSNLKEFTEAEEIGVLSLDVEYVAEQDCQLLFIPLTFHKRLTIMEKNAQYGQRKRFKPPKSGDKDPEALATLKRSYFFNSMGTYDLAELAIQSKFQSCSRGDKIFEEGKFPLYLYFLVKGVVRLQYTELSAEVSHLTATSLMHRRKNRKSITNIVNELEVFGLEEILTEQVYGCVATAGSDCYLLCIPCEAFTNIVNPMLYKSVYDNLMALIDSKRALLERSRHSNNIYKESMRQLAVGLENSEGKIRQRLQSLSQKKTNKVHTNNSESGKKTDLRSRLRQRNIRRYLPSEIMHTNMPERKFMGATEDLNFGLLESELRKAGSRTLSPIRTPIPIRSTPPFPKHVYQRFIINKLEEYESMDRAAFIDADKKEEEGSTLNFFKTRRRSIQQKQFQNLSASLSRTSRHQPQPNIEQQTLTILQ